MSAYDRIIDDSDFLRYREARYDDVISDRVFYLGDDCTGQVLLESFRSRISDKLREHGIDDPEDEIDSQDGHWAYEFAKCNFPDLLDSKEFGQLCRKWVIVNQSSEIDDELLDEFDNL